MNRRKIGKTEISRMEISRTKINKLRSGILIILIAATLFFAFAGCKRDKTSGTTPEKTSVQDTYPLTVTDALGNTVTINKEPVNISSLSLGSDEILLSLVEKARIRSLSPISEDPGLSNITNNIEGIEIIGTNAELIIAAQPDLVIVTDFTNADFIQQIKDAGIPAYAFATPGSIEAVKTVITDLAHILNAEEKGAELIGWMDEKLNNIKSGLDKLNSDEKKTALSLDSFYYTYGTGTTFDSIAKYAGVENLASSSGMELWVQLSKEQVVSLNPDMIMLPSWSYEGFDAVKFAGDFKSDPSLAEIKAIKNEMVFTLSEAHMTSFSQYMVLGAEDLAKTAYPELFKN